MNDSGKSFSMPGPQFNGAESSWLSWLKRNSQKITVGLIIFLVAVGGFYFYKSYQERTDLLGPDLNKITAESENGQTANQNSTPATIVKGAENKNTTTEPTAIKEDNQIVVSPAKGNGTTHLARQALKEFLKDKPEISSKLKAEQKIYIEDYLRKQITDAPKILQMTDSVAFSSDLIENAINKSFELTDNQLQNLQKYVPLAPSVNY